MSQYFNRTPVSQTRWAFIIDYLNENLETAKGMLTSAIQPEMIRADLYLENFKQGDPHLRLDILQAHDFNDILVCSIARPPFYNPNNMKQDIKNMLLVEFLMGIANQIELET